MQWENKGMQNVGILDEQVFGAQEQMMGKTHDKNVEMN